MAEAQSFSIDVRNLPTVRNRVKNISRDFGVPMKFLIQDQGRLWLIDLIKKIGNDPTRTIPQQKKLAHKRMSEDLNRIFIDDDDVLSKWESAIDAGLKDENEQGRIFKTKSGAIFGVEHKFYRPNASTSEMKNHHQRHRTKRGGVTKAGLNDRRIGRWKFIDVMYVRNAKFKKYLKEVKEKFGYAKAGFVHPLIHLIKETNGGLGGIPQYIIDVADAGNKGTVRDGMTNFGDGDIVIRNGCDYANELMTTGTFFASARTRQRDLMRSAQKRKDRIIKQFNGLNA